MGIGTTALACINLNVNFLGTEIDKEYIKIANEKIKSKYRTNNNNIQFPTYHNLQ
jgi:site-specific DNA-methyltransferase (adenine-specific)